MGRWLSTGDGYGWSGSPRRRLGGATLDKNRAIEVPLEGGGTYIADGKIVHAENQGSVAAPVRIGPEPGSDRSQLFDLASQCFELPRPGPGGGRRMAAWGRLGRGAAGRSALRVCPSRWTRWGRARSRCPRPPPPETPAAHAGLRARSPGTSIPPPLDVAPAVGGIPPEPPRRLRLQPLLRTLSSLAPPSGRGAAPRAQGGRKALRRLRRRHHPHL